MYQPSKGVALRYPALQEAAISHIGIPASARASVAALMHADLVPAKWLFKWWKNMIKATAQDQEKINQVNQPHHHQLEGLEDICQSAKNY